jgi:hypothetical protein
MIGVVTVMLSDMTDLEAKGAGRGVGFCMFCILLEIVKRRILRTLGR